MFDPTRISSFVNDFMKQLPPGLQSLNDDVKAQLQQCLQKSLHSLSLVTREEFDVQLEVLAKTRAKVEQLEAALSDLQAKL